MQHDIQSVSDTVHTLKIDTEHDIDNLTKYVKYLCKGMSKRVNPYIVQTRKELGKKGQEIITSPKTMLASTSEHKAETEKNVANLRQETNHKREYVDCTLNSISGEVTSNIRVCDSQIQSVKHANHSEIMRINNAISSLAVKITAEVANNNMTAIQQTVVARMATAGQTDSTGETGGSDKIGQSVNGVNACNVSTYSDSINVPNPSVNSRNNNVNAGSGLYGNNTDLSALTLPTFMDSTSHVPLHFDRDLYQYFSLKRTPGTKVSFGFPNNKRTICKQTFTELLWYLSR